LDVVQVQPVFVAGDDRDILAPECVLMSRIKDLFRQSPFDPLRDHMVKVMECVGLVRPMFEAVSTDHHENLEDITKNVFKKEHEADILKDEIRQTIPKTFYVPVFRGDLLGHLKLQDDMADACEDIAVLLTIKRLALPAAIRDEALTYVGTVIEVCNQADALTGEMQQVVRDGFDPDRVEQLLEAVRAIETAEWMSDRCQYKLSQQLFALEGEVSPVDIMLWFKVFGELGNLANYAESLADRIRRMLTSR
jgi:predicted phosphate transport protein (TIGR00153 family)